MVIGNALDSAEKHFAMQGRYGVHENHRDSGNVLVGSNAYSGIAATLSGGQTTAGSTHRGSPLVMFQSYDRAQRQT